jgi:DNA-binding beta-propeller fold protein YncE
LAYVTGASGSVIPIDTATNAAGTPIPVGDPIISIAITPNGATAYVLAAGSPASIIPIEIEYGPGDFAVMAPGHDAWTVGDEPCVVIDWQGYADYAKR